MVAGNRVTCLQVNVMLLSLPVCGNFFTGKAQVINSFVTNNSSHCEKNVMKAAICLMTSYGDTGKNGLDKHGNKDKDWLCSAHGSRGISGLLPGNEFL